MAEAYVGAGKIKMKKVIQLLKNNAPHMRRAGSYGLIITAGLLVMRLTAFAISVLIARFSGMETLGEFTLFITLFMLASEIPHAFDTAYLKATGVKDDEELRQLYESANIAIKLALSLALGFVLYMSSRFINEVFDSEVSGQIFLWAVVCGGLNSIYMILPVQAQRRFEGKRYALLKPVFNVLVLTLMLFGLTLGVNIDIEYVLRVYLVVGFVLSLWAIKNALVIGRLLIGRGSEIRAYLAVSMTLLLSVALNLIGNRLDVFFLGHYLNFEELGIYGAALRMSIVISVLTAVMATVMIPKAAAAAEDPAKFKRYISLGAFYSFVQLVGGLLLLLLLEPLMSLVFGDGYLDAVMPASILVCQVLVTSFGLPFQALIQCGERPSQLVYITLAKVIVSAILLFNLVPQFGVIGAALAILVTTILMSFLLVIIAWRARPVEAPLGA